MTRQYTDTIRLIVESYGNLTPELQKAAKFILENPEDVGLSSMRTIAKGAGVKPATVSRLSRRLGFDEYERFREPFRQRLRKIEPQFARAVESAQQRGADDHDALFAKLRTQEIANIEGTISDRNYPALLDAAETMHQSRRVYVLGLRGAYGPAFLFYYAYQLFQENSRLVDTRAGIFADQLRGIGNKDSLLVISFPPYTQLTIDAVNYAAEAGARIVAITDSAVSPAASAAGHTIITRNKSASFYHSFIGALAVTQTLITLLVTKKGGDAVRIAREAENQLSKISAYW
jgi:DNA-binding MurR/RpiR family transcriptional regulator